MCWCETTCLFIHFILWTVILSVSCHPHPVLAKAMFPDWTQKQRKGHTSITPWPSPDIYSGASFPSAPWPGWTALQPPAKIHCEVCSGLDACDALLLELIQCISPYPPGFCLRVPHHPPGQFPLTEAPPIGQLRVSSLDLTGTSHEVDLLYRSEVLSVQ